MPVTNKVSKRLYHPNSSSSHRTCLKYTNRHTTDGTRLLVVCDVALGKCQDVHKRDLTLTQAPDGYQSVHGVRSTPSVESDFEVSSREEGLPMK